MLVADEIGDTATRDDCLMKLTTKHRAEGPKTAQICEIFQKSLQKGDGSLDIKGLDQILATIPEPKRAQHRVHRRPLPHESRQGLRRSRPTSNGAASRLLSTNGCALSPPDALRGRKDTKAKEVRGTPSADLGPAERHESGGLRGLRLGKPFVLHPWFGRIQPTSMATTHRFKSN